MELNDIMESFLDGSFNAKRFEEIRKAAETNTPIELNTQNEKEYYVRNLSNDLQRE